MKTTKMMGVFEKASAQIRDLEHELCPTNSFMSKLPGSTYEFSLVNETGSEATSEDVVNLFGKYLKYQDDVADFCTYSDYCTTAGLSEGKIFGAGIGGDIYFGIEILDDIDDCPSYRMPNDETGPTKFNPKYTNDDDKDEEVQCWGKLYIDVNGKNPSNTYGDDVYVFGLGEFGIVK